MFVRTALATAALVGFATLSQASTASYTEADYGGDYGDFATPLNFGTVSTLTTFSGSVFAGQYSSSDYNDAIGITLLGSADISWSRSVNEGVFYVYEGDTSGNITQINSQPITFGPGTYVLLVNASWESGLDYTLTVDPVAVPLPAAGWLLLAGLGGLTVLRRRR